MVIVKANWGDLGFRRIGPRDPADADESKSVELLAKALEKVGGYEIQHDESGWWIRDPARVRNRQRPDAVSVAAVLDSANHRQPEQYDFVRSLNASYYRNYQFDLSPEVRHDNILKFSSNPRSAKGIYALTFSVAGCPIPELEQFLSSVLLPSFFNIYKNGKVIFLSPNYAFEKRHSAMRAGYTASQYGRLDRLGVGDNPFQTMERWQPLMPSVQLRLVLELATLLFFPHHQFFTGTRSGLLTVFVPGEPFVEYKNEFPAGWRDLYTDHWDFAKGERFAANLAKLADAAAEPDSLKPIFEKATYDASEIEELIRWLVERYNVIAFHQTDPAEFLDGDLVDFVTCFEHALTLDRALRKGISCAVSVESVARKEAAMEIADIIGELARFWGLANDGPEYFKRLVHPTTGQALVKKAFATAPASFSSVVANVTDSIYAHLRDTIYNSVFVPTKRTGSGILVRDRTLSSESAESADDFATNVIRALRNTHHGYLSRNDRRLRPSRYLALVNGSLPEAFARLGTVLALAATVAPQETFGWNFLPERAFD
jgi:hypothetical protein